MIVGALEVPDHRISNTELLSDKKRTLLDTHCGPQMYAASTIVNRSLYTIDCKSCFGTH